VSLHQLGDLLVRVGDVARVVAVEDDILHGDPTVSHERLQRGSLTTVVAVSLDLALALAVAMHWRSGVNGLSVL